MLVEIKYAPPSKEKEDPGFPNTGKRNRCKNLLNLNQQYHLPLQNL